MPRFHGKLVRRVTNGAFFSEGREMLVWDCDKHFVYIRKVYYIIAPELEYPYPVITYDPHHQTEAWRFCAYVPKGVKVVGTDFPYCFDGTDISSNLTIKEDSNENT